MTCNISRFLTYFCPCHCEGQDEFWTRWDLPHWTYKCYMCTSLQASRDTGCVDWSSWLNQYHHWQPVKIWGCTPMLVLEKLSNTKGDPTNIYFYHLLLIPIQNLGLLKLWQRDIFQIPLTLEYSLCCKTDNYHQTNSPVQEALFLLWKKNWEFEWSTCFVKEETEMFYELFIMCCQQNLSINKILEFLINSGVPLIYMARGK